MNTDDLSPLSDLTAATFLPMVDKPFCFEDPETDRAHSACLIEVREGKSSGEAFRTPFSLLFTTGDAVIDQGTWRVSCQEPAFSGAFFLFR